MKPLTEPQLRQLLQPYRLTPDDVRHLGGGREDSSKQPSWAINNWLVFVRYYYPFVLRNPAQFMIFIANTPHFALYKVANVHLIGENTMYSA